MKPLPFLYIILVFLFIAGCKNSHEEEKVLLKEYFEMLPADLLPEFISREKCIEQLQSIDDYYQGWSDAGPIRTYDENNGYMSLSETEYDWVLTFRKLNNGKKMLLVNDSNESGSHIRIFFYKDGKLIEDTKYKPYDNVVYVVDDFVDLSMLSDEAIEAANHLFRNNMYHIYYHLPESGDTITVAARFEDSDNYDNEYVDEINFEAFKLCTLIWIDDKWVKE